MNIKMLLSISPILSRVPANISYLLEISFVAVNEPFLENMKCHFKKLQSPNLPFYNTTRKIHSQHKPSQGETWEPLLFMYWL